MVLLRANSRNPLKSHSHSNPRIEQRLHEIIHRQLCKRLSQTKYHPGPRNFIKLLLCRWKKDSIDNHLPSIQYHKNSNEIQDKHEKTLVIKYANIDRFYTSFSPYHGGSSENSETVANQLSYNSITRNIYQKQVWRKIFYSTNILTMVISPATAQVCNGEIKASVFAFGKIKKASGNKTLDRKTIHVWFRNYDKLMEWAQI